MKDPENPVGPAFDQARDQMEAQRQQQLLALNQLQREFYQGLVLAQQQKQEEQRKAQAQGAAKEIRERTRKHLTPKNDHEMRPPGARSAETLQVGDLMRNSKAARSERASQELRQRVRQARERAKGEIAREHALARQITQFAHQRERDAYLENCCRGRHVPKGRAAELRENARDVTWQSALQKAARDEGERDRSHSISDGFNKAR